MTQRERWEKVEYSLKNETDLEVLVSKFFEILDTKETTDEGREFSPVYISSCRVFLTFQLSIILTRMKELLERKEDE